MSNNLSSADEQNLIQVSDDDEEEQSGERDVLFVRNVRARGRGSILNRNSARRRRSASSGLQPNRGGRGGGRRGRGSRGRGGAVSSAHVDRYFNRFLRDNEEQFESEEEDEDYKEHGNENAWFLTKGSTSSILNHYQTIHSAEYEAAELIDPNANPVEQAGDIRSFTVMGPKERQKIDEAVVRYICKDLLPFNTVEKSGFVDLISTVSKNRYEIGKRSYYQERMNSMYTAAVESSKEIFKSVLYFSSTIDIWKPNNLQKRIVGFTIHWMNEQTFTIKSLPIGLIEHDERLGSLDSARIESYMHEIYVRFGIQRKLFTISSDAGGNVINAVIRYQGNNEDSRVLQLACCSHALNRSVWNELFAGYNSNLEKLRNLHTLVEGLNLEAATCFRNAQVDLDLELKPLIRDVETRWWSSFDMLTRALEQKRAIVRFCSTFNGAPQINENDWTIFSELHKCLIVCSATTKLLEGQKYGTLPIVVRVLEGLYHHLQVLSQDETLTEIGRDFSRRIKADLRRRSPFWNSVTSIPEVYLVAALLDPCHKNLDFLESESAKSRAHEAFKKFYQDFCGGNAEVNNDESEFVYEGNGRGDIDEISRYIALPQLRDVGGGNERVENHDDPIQIRWWRHVRGQFPNIYKLACMFWAAPASSAPCERLFSKASLVWDVLRNLIDTENASSQLFLHYYYNV
jgi:hypothetical protein